MSLCEESHCWKQAAASRVCDQNNTVFFLSFFNLFRTTPRCSVCWQAGGKETDGVTVGERSILALIKMGLGIHVWQRNYNLGMLG